MPTLEELYNNKSSASGSAKTNVETDDALQKIYNQGTSAATTDTSTSVLTPEGAKDAVIAPAVGAIKGLTYLIDLPDTVISLLDMGADLTSDGAAFALSKFTGEDPDEFKARRKKVKDFKKEIRDYRITPGKLFRENVVTYKPKTTTGRYLESIGEWAAPGGAIGKLSKAGKVMASTGAVSGAIEEGVQDLTGSGAIGTGTGIATNIALDMYALSRGKPATFIKDIQPSKTIIAKTKETQKAASDRGLTLTAGEASGTRAIMDTEANIAANPIGAKIFDDFYETRPVQIKKYINSVAKEFGFITNKNKLSPKMVGIQTQKAAVYLTQQRTKLWELSGGKKFRGFDFAQKDVNTVVKQIDDLIKNPEYASVVKSLKQFRGQIKGNTQGKFLHDAWKEIRDIGVVISKNTNKTVSDLKLKKATDEILESLDTNVFSTNKDFANAQRKYKQYTKAYLQPINEAKIFKDIQTAGWANNVDTFSNVLRFIKSDKLNARAIEKIGRSFSKSGNKENFRIIVSSYFDDVITKAFVDSYGNVANPGLQIHKALVGSPKARENFTEIIFQMAKANGSKLTKTQMQKSVDSFSDVLIATTRKAKTGSQTASRQQQTSQLESNIGSSIAGSKGGLPILGWFDEWARARTLSSNSKLFGEMFTSQKGIDTFIKMAENYKDPARILALFKGFVMTGNES
tara:strand:- start:55 stop:2112 length:2058 start_codon:yes stop_codon:yes gene_type:complete